MINPLSTSISGLQAASKKVAVASSNVANADVVGSTDAKSPNQAYSAKTTQDISAAGGGVQTVVLNRNPPFVPSPPDTLIQSAGVHCVPIHWLFCGSVPLS